MFEGHDPKRRYRARVEDREGDRWAVTGTLAFLDMHCTDQRLRIVWLKPITSPEEGDR